MTCEIINKTELFKAIRILKPDNQLFECRIIFNNKQTYSGYFRSAETLWSAFDDIQDFANCNVYITLNTLNNQCYNRSQHDRFKKNADATTSDNDVDGYDWMLIDLDPKRPTKTSSSDEQLRKAQVKCKQIGKFLQNVGFEKPVIGFSGNGYHLLYKINMQVTTDNKKLLEMCLKTLSMLFSDEDIDVDMKNFNPSRVCKLYGTRAQKGTSTDGAPHRMSRILYVPEELKPTDRNYLEKLTTFYPQEEAPQKYNNYRPRDFNLQEWLNRYGIEYRKESFKEGDKYILAHCPFDSNHTGKDAVIFQLSSGALAFNCFHNSCADKKWRDVRLLFEPDAYERKQQEYEKRIYAKSQVQDVRRIKPKEGTPVFYTAMDVFNLPQEEERFIKTGIREIDKRMRGLKIGAVTVMSGLRASAKSTCLGGIVLECNENGNKVGVFSGELSPRNFMRWINLQAAGKANVEPTQYENWYNVNRNNQKSIAEWLGMNFHLYNNEYGNDYQAVREQFQKKIEQDRLDLLILDNLMAFNISGLAENKYEAQTAFVWSLHEMAEKMNVHILFVAHPRKAMGFLRLDDISGTADLGNAVDNALIIHRVNNDFKRLTAQMFGWKEDNKIYRATNIIEIAKDRDGGNQDIFIPLWYEPESKRLKNDPAENKIYGWDKKSDGFVPLKADEDPVFD